MSGARTDRASTADGRGTLWNWLSTGRKAKAAIVVFNSLLVAALWLVVTERLRVEREDTVRIAVERNDVLATVVEEYTVRTLEGADAVLRYLIREKQRGGGQIDLAKFVADYTVDSRSYAGLVLANEYGEGLTTATGTAGEPVRQLNVRDREHFRVHEDRDSEKLFVGKPVTGRVSGKVVVPLTRRVNKADGSFDGVAMVLIEPSRFTDVLQDARMRPLDIISLVGLDGITRARLSGTVASSGEDIRKSPLFSEQAKRPIGNYAAPGAIDDIPRLFSYRTLTDYAVMATVGAAESDVLAEFNARRARYLAAAATFSVVIVGFTFLLVFALVSQRRAATTVAQSRARFLAAFNQAAVGIIHSGMDLRIQEVNGKVCAMLGYSREELLARSVADITHAEDVPPHDVLKERLLGDAGGEASVQFEKRYLRKDGTQLWCEVALSLVRDDRGAPEYFATVVLDISARKQAEESLAAYEAEQRRLARQVEWDRARLIEAQAVAKVGSWETNLLTMEVNWSDENYRIFGVERVRFQPTHAGFLQMVHPDDRSAVDSALANSLAGGGACEIEHRIVTAQGGIKFVEERWKVHRDDLGRPQRAIGTTQDITERKRAETALRVTNNRLKALSARLQRAEEGERRRISRELHDQVGQELTALTLDLKTLARRSPGPSPVIERCIAAVGSLLMQVRDLTLMLRPSQLDDLGLVAALRGHVQHHVSVHGVEVHFDAAVSPGRVGPDLEVACFRIAQEALTNVLRHAGARNVWLSLRESAGELHLGIRDDGKGFDPDTALGEGKSSGLRNLFDRAELAGGSLKIDSASGAGTTIVARFSLEHLGDTAP